MFRICMCIYVIYMNYMNKYILHMTTFVGVCDEGEIHKGQGIAVIVKRLN